MAKETILDVKYVDVIRRINTTLVLQSKYSHDRKKKYIYIYIYIYSHIFQIFGYSFVDDLISEMKEVFVVETRLLKPSTFSVWKHSQKNIEGNKLTSFAIAMGIESTTFTRVIQLQQRPSHQRLNKKLNFKISFSLLMKLSNK